MVRFKAFIKLSYGSAIKAHYVSSQNVAEVDLSDAT
ncbi:protein of unknown function [Pseudodesulfovibrio profundus]|uniref:Uncharacterized protein n=1 Tax=Pseudodesulfovibrio profundus TaxID=57320 RepID=A0A2C8F3S9_9BACT|nr:protein of unknown function [Pseudodesulfovibrio profundus]